MGKLRWLKDLDGHPQEVLVEHLDGVLSLVSEAPADAPIGPLRCVKGCFHVRTALQKVAEGVCFLAVRCVVHVASFQDSGFSRFHLEEDTPPTFVRKKIKKLIFFSPSARKPTFHREVTVVRVRRQGGLTNP